MEESAETFAESIGYEFSNPGLLEKALTHPSLAYESRKQHSDNQRLEFLGDAVLQLIITNKLYELFPRFPEGRLTKLRSRLVSREALCRFANKISLGGELLLGKGEASTGGRERPSNLADAVEALIGAVYLDGGLESATQFVLNNWGEFIHEIEDQPHEINPKGKLQEALQSISPVSPTYRILEAEGPDHAKTFRAEVIWEGTSLGEGVGHSKKAAETSAATNALEQALWKADSTGGGIRVVRKEDNPDRNVNSL
ncbi:MAG: ribonuclease III [Verrucomicrobiota bacterium]